MMTGVDWSVTRQGYRTRRGSRGGSALSAARAVGVALIAILAGCAGSPQAPAAASNHDLTPDEARQKKVLSDDDRARLLAAMRTVAEGHEPVNPPAPAPGGMRWSDVPAAVAAACGASEMAVRRTVREQGGVRIRFELRTIEEWPGELIVDRVEGPATYRAEARIGRFPDEPECLGRAEKLLDQLAISMRRLGRKRGFNEPVGSADESGRRAEPLGGPITGEQGGTE
jgi:hypothetical protein